MELNLARQEVAKSTNVYFMMLLMYQIAVVIFPSQNELRLRAEQRFKEMGKEVPAEAVNEMIGIHHHTSKKKKSFLSIGVELNMTYVWTIFSQLYFTNNQGHASFKGVI